MERDLERYFDIEKVEDITTRVISSIERDSPRMENLIKEKFPFGKNRI